MKKRLGIEDAFPSETESGLTKRELLAGMLLAGYGVIDTDRKDVAAKLAVEAAEALLTELEKS